MADPFNTPFFDAVVPTPGGSPAGGGTTGGLPVPAPGVDPVLWAFQERIGPTPGTDETPNASGLQRVDLVGIEGSGVRARNIDLETPSKNLAGGD
jgi:hypothetical protein